MKKNLVILCCLHGALWAQEANSGFELRGTATGAAFYSHDLEEAPREGGTFTGGFRTMLYPTWKLNKNWAISGAIQTHSRPYFSEEFYTQGYGVKTDILQAHLSYSRFWKDRSVVVRLGQLSTAFGSFLLRYDDADNPLVDMPLSYGYYYKPVSTFGLAGAQVDATLGKLDMRAQFVNSSPANRRSVFDSDQYGNWAGGVGYTIKQGLRVGVSAYRGPYLHRQYLYFEPGEARPRDLPASGYGIDAQWGQGRWNVYAELQRFQMGYRITPTFDQRVGYVEARRVLHPRVYAAGRFGWIRNEFDGREVYEVAAGLRPNRYQLIKLGYQIERDSLYHAPADRGFTIQFVTSFHAISIARD